MGLAAEAMVSGCFAERQAAGSALGWGTAGSLGLRLTNGVGLVGVAGYYSTSSSNSGPIRLAHVGGGVNFHTRGGTTTLALAWAHADPSNGAGSATGMAVVLRYLYSLAAHVGLGIDTTLGSMNGEQFNTFGLGIAFTD